MHGGLVVRRLMPFTALKPATVTKIAPMILFRVVRRLMPFTALKRPPTLTYVSESEVVRRLMPFTALKRMLFLYCIYYYTGCAPPNAVYGIETP